MMILGKKLGQTSFLDSKGKRVCATVLDYKGCMVIGNRTQDKDGYIANIIGFLKPKKLTFDRLFFFLYSFFKKLNKPCLFIIFSNRG